MLETSRRDGPSPRRETAAAPAPIAPEAAVAASPVEDRVPTEVAAAVAPAAEAALERQRLEVPPPVALPVADLSVSGDAASPAPDVETIRQFKTIQFPRGTRGLFPNGRRPQMSLPPASDAETRAKQF